MVDPDADLSEVASEMVEAFIAAAIEEVDGTVVAEFFERFEDDVKTLLTEKDVLPALDDMRGALVVRLDG